MDVLVQHHVHEHDEEDEGVRPCPVCDELLHDGSLAPSLLDRLEEFHDGEHEQHRLESKRYHPGSVTRKRRPKTSTSWQGEPVILEDRRTGGDIALIVVRQAGGDHDEDVAEGGEFGDEEGSEEH